MDKRHGLMSMAAYSYFLLMTVFSVPVEAQYIDPVKHLIQLGNKGAETYNGEEILAHTDVHQITDLLQRTLLDESITITDVGLTKNGNVSAQCMEDGLVVLESLQHGEPWVLQMIDSFGKPPSGILQGNFLWLGSYEQCISLNTNTSFDTQFCTAGLKGGILSSISQVSPSGISLGVCVPDSCSPEDVQLLINKGLSMLPVPYNASRIDGARCIPKTVSLDTAAIAVICLLSVIGLLLLTGTLYDIYHHLVPPPAKASFDLQAEINIEQNQESTGDKHPIINIKIKDEPSMLSKILMSFSVYTNAAKLLNTSQTEKSIRCIHGIRFFSMTWVILGHTYVFGIPHISNLTDELKLYKRWTFQAIGNATVSVDTFFLLSGLLATYLLCSELKRLQLPSKLNWPMVYFHRFWRLTPPYMLLIAMWTTLFTYVGQGPQWPYSDSVDPNCQKYWWTNLLYVNNIVHKDQMCMGWSWFLANDMQFFLITPLIIVPLFLWWKIGLGIVFGLLLVNLVTTGVIMKVNEFGPTGGGADGHDYFGDVYISPWCRVGAYLIGVLAGYALYWTDRKIKLHWAVVCTCWAAATASALAVLYGLYGYYQGDHWSDDLSAFYGSMNRPVWSLAVAWVIFACATGYGGIVNTILSWPALVPLSRLTYMAYLVHPMVIFWFYFSRTTPLYVDDPMIIYLYLGHVTISYCVAFAVSVSLEAPMLGLEKVILKRS